ncbi:MAG: efflux RND transporter periplasmic adaptor subunit [Rhodothermales bacterium]
MPSFSLRLSRLLLAALCVITFGCSSDEAASSGGGGWGGRGGGGGTPSVEVIQARYGALPLQERLTGTVVAENQVMIYAEISAPIMRVAVENGARVQAGAPLVYLRDTQFREQLRQQEAALSIAEADANRADAQLRELQARLDRTQQLADRQFESAQQLETLQAQVDIAEAGVQQAKGRIAQAQANVDEAKEALRRTVVRAPISGRVGQRNAEVGMRTDPGTRLFTMGNFDNVEVHIAITDDKIGVIEEGMTALIASETFDFATIEAQVSRISPFLEVGSYTAAAEIDVPNGTQALRPGMFVTVDVLYGESEQATLIPTSALYEDPSTGVVGVFVAPSLGNETPLEEPETFDELNPPAYTDETPMTFREIEVLAEGRGLVGVTGVQGGDWIVTVGQNLLAGRPEVPDAKARPITWSRIADLQQMQDQDLLRQFMDKQQRMAREAFAKPTSAADTPAPVATETPSPATATTASIGR